MRKRKNWDFLVPSQTTNKNKNSAYVDMKIETFSKNLRFHNRYSKMQKAAWATYSPILIWSYPHLKLHNLSRGHRELLDGRLCMPDSAQRPLVSNFITMAIVKLCCQNFTQIANFMIFFVSTISFTLSDLFLLKEFSKNVSFWKFYIFH